MEEAFVLACFACEELEHARVTSDLVFLVGDQCSGDQLLTPQCPLKNPVQWTVGQEEAEGTRSPTTGFLEMNGLKRLRVHVRAQAL